MIFDTEWPSIRACAGAGYYRDGVDVERHMPELATDLGHAHITDHLLYLTATPRVVHGATAV